MLSSLLPPKTSHYDSAMNEYNQSSSVPSVLMDNDNQYNLTVITTTSNVNVTSPNFPPTNAPVSAPQQQQFQPVGSSDGQIGFFLFLLGMFACGVIFYLIGNLYVCLHMHLHVVVYFYTYR
jgi:hypothetical protein